MPILGECNSCNQSNIFLITDAVKIITANPTKVSKYLDKTKKPTALRSLIQKQTEDLELEPFAKQLLTAKSWYKGKDAVAAENIFKEMISNVIKGVRTAKEAMDLSIPKINQTL